MTEVMAVFENGVLRPLSPLELAEGQRVRLLVEPSTGEATLEAALQPLIAAGLLVNPPHLSEVPSIAEAELRQLVESLKATSGQPLSEMIIEDRGKV
jgi:predicted DNA-binding antitoxin AbrB/MazE fold protein